MRLRAYAAASARIHGANILQPMYEKKYQMGWCGGKINLPSGLACHASYWRNATYDNTPNTKTIAPGKRNVSVRRKKERPISCAPSAANKKTRLTASTIGICGN
jgi:hypothetical protein